MARRSDHTRNELHELIITTAIRIIDDEGFAALSARKISGEIGYSAGTIYNVYKSMDDLIVTINARSLDIMASQIKSLPHSVGQTPCDQLKAMAKIYLNFVHSHKERWFALFTPIERAILSLYAESSTTGSSKDAKLAARTLWASVHGICFIDQSGKMPLVSTQYDASNMVNCLIDSFVAGLRA